VGIMTKELEGAIFQRIDAIEPLSSVGVGYTDGMSTRLLRRATPTLSDDIYVILDEQDLGPDPVPPPVPPGYSQSKLGAKLVDVGLNCGGAILAGAAATAGVAAAPVTGGTSTILTVIAGAAALAAAAQCGISIGQATIEFTDPGSNDRYLDNEEWFKATGYFLDGVQLIGIAASIGPAYKSIGKVVQMQRTTGKSFAEIIRGLNRAERKLLAKELQGYGKTLSRKQWLQLARAGRIPKVFTNKAITQTVVEQLVNGIGNCLGLYGSKRSGNIGFVVSIVQTK
jgi:hypothetical protein